MTVEWTKTCRTVITTNEGEPYYGNWEPVTEADYAQFKDVLKEYITKDNWQINLDTATGWIIVPGRAVSSVEIEFKPYDLPLPKDTT